MTQINATVRLFLSFTGLLYKMRDGEVTPADLEGALFYFGCTEEYAFDPWGMAYANRGRNDVENVFKDDPMKGREVHAAIVEALAEAKADGRAAFRFQLQERNLDTLNIILVGKGYAPLDPDSMGQTAVDYRHVTDFTVRKLAERAGLSITVVAH